MKVKQLAAERAKINETALFRCRAILGGAQAIADNLGLARQTVSLWKEVPAPYVRQLAVLCKITPAEVLPDPYPYPESGVLNEKATERKKVGRPKGPTRAEA
jgi:hypothetical protein